MTSLPQLLRGVARVQTFAQNFDWQRPYLSQPIQTGSGTAFVIRATPTHWTFVTAAHVVAQALKVTIKFAELGDTQYPAESFHIVPEFDIAWFRVARTNFSALTGYNATVLRMASFDEVCKLEPGDPIIALGFPLGFPNPKVNKGTFNGREREELQYDAPTAPGSSGGPILANGKVVGVISWKVVSGGAEAMQFAKPINLLTIATGLPHISVEGHGGGDAEDVVFRLPHLGMCLQAQTDEKTLAAVCGPCTGARVTNVLRDSAADVAGIRVGDVVQTVHGHTVTAGCQVAGVSWAGSNMVSFSDFVTQILHYRAIKIGLRRLHDDRAVEAVLRPIPKADPITTRLPAYEHIPYLVWDGLVMMNACKNLMDLDSAGATLRHLPYADRAANGASFVVVVSVVPESRAAKHSGIAPGAIVTHINGSPTTDVQQMGKLCSASSIDDGVFTLQTRSPEGEQLFTTTTQLVYAFALHMIALNMKPASTLAWCHA